MSWGMSSVAILNIEFYLSVVSWTVVVLAFWRPLAMRDRRRALLIIAIANSFRHIGMIYVQPAVIAPPLPDSFAIPTAYGDLLTAAIATVAAIALLRGWRGQFVLAWAFNVVGFVDLGLAVYHAFEIQYVTHHVGVGYLLPAIVVPGLLVGHVASIVVLARSGASSR